MLPWCYSKHNSHRLFVPHVWFRIFTAHAFYNPKIVYTWNTTGISRRCNKYKQLSKVSDCVCTLYTRQYITSRNHGWVMQFYELNFVWLLCRSNLWYRLNKIWSKNNTFSLVRITSIYMLYTLAVAYKFTKVVIVYHYN